MQGEAVDVFSLEAPLEEYRRVRCRGRLDEARTVFIGPRARSAMGKTEQGYVAVTPLCSEAHAGRGVLVNRGWVPATWRQEAEAAAAAAAAAGPGGGGGRGAVVEVEGVVRLGEDPGTFVPANDPGGGAWFFLDPRQLAAAAGLPPGTALVEAISDEEGTKLVSPGGPPTAMDVLGGRGARPRAKEEYPLPKTCGDLLAFSVMPRDHANYAATWFTLSAATGALALKALKALAKR
jgi:surfeit locus 1 family protein